MFPATGTAAGGPDAAQALEELRARRHLVVRLAAAGGRVRRLRRPGRSLRVGRVGLRWWERFGVLKCGIICVMQAMRHLRGGARSVEPAAIGRRVCETE
ncbi:hypothetical protein ABZ897_37475 [Nonomuraea sp. NPDC046802]|uniref:hypothetical protein n=1 Tax=Nonomuraea sp. NPDC046802 TaxID=3154919 RepID=UPI0033F16C7D